YRQRYEQLVQDRGHKDIQEGKGGPRVHWRSPAEVLRQVFRVVVDVARGTNIPPDPRDGRPPLFEGAEIVYEVETQPDPVKPPKTGRGPSTSTSDVSGIGHNRGPPFDPPDWIELRRIVNLKEASRLAGLSVDSIKSHHAGKIIDLSPRRRGMRLGDA